ncbi:hypothetical protein PSTT_01890 [Puccinia striiformis]|uniref:Uncharacterized protein n=3 Tax=Puccinia striiformis TaxID=27350 RepID=A0A2S4W1J3_9BASI|nr:hypothetical protein PSTT_01890 [Puccinia striiformis]
MIYKSTLPRVCRRMQRKVQWKKCETSMRVDYENPPAENAPEGKLTGWALMRHDGFHNHPWPVPKKLDTVSMHALAAVVLKNPKAGALQLKMGTPNTDPGAIPQQPFESVVDIHPALLNTDAFDITGVNPTQLKHASRKGLNIVSASLRKGQEHFTFQTDWMARLSGRCEEGNKLYSGGLLSDVTYRFFDTGYLLTTSMYCQTIQRWIPVQLSWIRGLSAKYYEMHFSVLFRQFLDPSISESEREAITLSVLDFSAAQRSGYIAAYPLQNRGRPVERMPRTFQAIGDTHQKEPAGHHGDEVGLFNSMCEGLLLAKVPDGKTHEEKVDELRRRFPKTQRWIDWWTVADVEAMLFPGRRKMLEDSPNGDGLPDTTNAQESMHRVYYMFSTGKKALLVGMIELFAFVKALERDWQAVMRGIPIGYGTQAKLQINVAQSIGMKKPTKRQMATTNDGRPPDTSAALGLDDIQPNKVAKLGPQKTLLMWIDTPSQPLSRTSPVMISSCATAAGWWLHWSHSTPCIVHYGCSSHLARSPNCSTPSSHISNRTTYEMTNSTSVRSILTRGSKGIFEVARAINPTNFVYGEFGSLNMFIGMALDPESNSSKTLPNLFRVHESRVFSCSNHQQQIAHPRGSRGVTAIPISKLAFERNSIPMTDPARLITQWFGSGLAGTSSLACKSGNSKKAQAGPTQSHMLDQHSVLTFEGDQAPPHLYFVVDTPSIDDHNAQVEFMAQMDWPFKLSVARVEYTLISRGFWGRKHYWGKVLRHVNGVTGVWLHDDRENKGYARLVNRVPGSIGGPQPDTSWLIYSRRWTPDESEFMAQSIEKIRRDNPRFQENLPFVKMAEVLNISPYADETHVAGPSASAQ